MPPVPPIDKATLVRLRELAAVLHENRGPAVPVVDLVRLSQSVRLRGGVTIDFEASESLGQPMIVLRMPAEGAGGDNANRGDALTCLSRREIEVSSLIAEGMSNKQIARRLFLSTATIKDHVHRILTKTGLSNRAAVAAAYHGRLSRSSKPVD